MDLVSLIKTVGYLGVFAIIFAESGLLIGFFLPGDSLLFTAGFLASQNILHFPILTFGSFVSAVLGDQVGYSFGRKIGPKIFKKEDSLFFHKDNILKAEAFYEKYGKKTIVLARFFPIIRTFAPIVAGVGKMHYPTFVSYNIIGGFFWTVGITTTGYFLGKTIPDVDRYLLPILTLVIFLSLLPSMLHLVKDKKIRSALKEKAINGAKKLTRKKSS